MKPGSLARVIEHTGLYCEHATDERNLMRFKSDNMHFSIDSRGSDLVLIVSACDSDMTLVVCRNVVGFMLTRYMEELGWT